MVHERGYPNRGGRRRRWRAYIDAARLLHEAMQRQLARDSGIGFADFEIVVASSEASDRRLRMADVAERIMTVRGEVSRAPARLVCRMGREGHLCGRRS